MFHVSSSTSDKRRVLWYLVSVVVGAVQVVRGVPVVGRGELPGALGADGPRLALLLLAPRAHARAHAHAHAAVDQRLRQTNDLFYIITQLGLILLV